jgi:hypothetical protein
MVRQRGACGTPLLLGRPGGSPRFFLWGRMGARRRGNHGGVAPTVCREPSPVGADPCVRPSTNAIHAGAANGATTGGCPYGLP